MSRNHSKLISALLALCLIIGMAPFALPLTVSAEPAATYYMYGGTGDGSSASSPAGDLSEVITAINNAGYGEGDEVILYVMDAEDAFTYRPAVTGRGQTASHLTAWGTPSVKHTATIRVKGYKGTDSHLIYQPEFGSYTDAGITGPVVFDDITLVSSRLCDQGICACGYKLVTEPSVVFTTLTSDFASAGEIWDGNLRDGKAVLKGGTAGNSATWDKQSEVVLDSLNNTGADLYLSTWRETRTPIEGDTTFRIKQLNGSALLYWIGVNNLTYNKNVNLSVGGGVGGLTISSGSGKVVHKGAIQMIVNSKFKNGVTLPSTVSAAGGIYRLNVDEDDVLDFTETAGAFTVNNGGSYVYVVDTAKNSIYYGDSALTVPAGTYDVQSADSVEAIKEVGEILLAREGSVLSWNESKEGVLKAVYYTPSTAPAYYYMYGGTGDGSSAESPAGNLSELIAKINSDGHGEGDDVDLFVMDAADAFTYCPAIGGRGVTASHLTAWGNPTVSHTATIRVKGYQGIDSHLIYQPEFGSNVDASITGPVIFDDITLVSSRLYDQGICACGHTLEVKQTVVFQTLSADFGSSGDVWDGKLKDGKSVLKGGTAGASSTWGKKSEVILDSPNGIGSDLYLATWRETRTPIEGDTTFRINQLKGSANLRWVGVTNLTYNKNVNLFVGEKVDGFTISSGSGTVVHNGAIQMIVNSKFKNSAALPSAVSAAGGIYRMNVDRDDLLDFTETAGTFAVNNDGKFTYAVDMARQTIYYGEASLSVATGTYDVQSAESLEDIKAMGENIFAREGAQLSWDESKPGVLKVVYDSQGGVPTYYYMYGGSGAGGASSSPSGSLDSIITAINNAGYGEGDEVILYVMDAEDAFTYRPAVTGREQTASHLTAWGNPTVAHTATIRVKGYKGTDSHLIYQSKFGSNTDAGISGPVVFDNITLVSPRLHDQGICACGHKLVMEDSVVFNSLTNDFGSAGNVWDGKLKSSKAIVKGGTVGNNALGEKSEVVLNSLNSSGADLYLVTWREAHSPFKEDLTYRIKQMNGSVTLYWIGVNSVRFNRNVNLEVGASVNSLTISCGSASAAHDDAIQMIMNSKFKDSAALPSSITAGGGIYRMNVAQDGLLDFTETAGTFTVADGYVALAVNTVTGAELFSADSQLTVPAGTYDVTFMDSADMESKMVYVYMDSDEVIGYKGYSMTLPQLEDTLVKRFVGWVDEYGAEYEGGTKFIIPDDAEDMMFFDSQWENYEGVSVVFLNEVSGNDDYDGSLERRPVQTLSRAMELAEASTEPVSKIIIIGTFGYTGAMPSNKRMITISGDGSGQSVFDLNNDYILLGGPITFENIKLSASTTLGGKYLTTTGHELVIGEGVTQGEKSMAIRFGTMYYGTNAAKEVATLKSGTFGTIDVGSFYNNSEPGKTAGADIVIDGATVNALYFRSDGWLDTQKGNEFTDSVRVYVKSGSLKQIAADFISARKVTFADTATFQAIINTNDNVDTADFTGACKAGAWIMKGGAVKGCGLEFTDTPGTYQVLGANYAVATATSGNRQYVSDGGILKVPAGTYTMQYLDKLEWLFDGEKITVYSDSTIDLTTVTAPNVPGKLFIGWQKQDGTAPANVASYSEGDIVTAQYIDFTTGTTGDFYIVGAQIRTSGVQGLRFIMEKKNSFSDALPEIIDFGALVLPTDLTRGHDMKYGEALTNEYAKGLPAGVGTTTWANNTPAIVAATKLYKDTADGVQYTLCITGIDTSKYYRYYTVKGYIRYNDLNGNAHIVYTDYYQTNLYQVALAALKNREAPIETFEGIKGYVEVTRKEEYMAENYDTRKLLSGYSTTADTDPNHAMYQLANGLKVREVEFDFNTSGVERDSIDIIHFADTHLNYINDQDWEEQDPCVLSTYRGRSWNRNGGSVTPINKAMEYASFFDRTVVTGDLMDYFSWGCAEMIQKLMIDKDKDILMAMGNHEPARLMQNDDPSLRDTMPVEEKYARLSTFWPHDVKYYSEIMTNDNGDEMVMLVVLDNQRDLYWDEQIEPLTNDIALAREKGLKILIFQHDPICTVPGGVDDDWVTYFYEAGDTSGMTVFDGVKYSNFGKQFAGSSGRYYSDATKTVYDLITDNADVVSGVFCGHWHNHMYSEIKAKTANGQDKVIPQYVVTANAYGGSVIKITVK